MNGSFRVINPYTEQQIDEYNYSSWEKVKAAIAILKAGRQTQTSFTAFQRANILRRLAQLLEEHAEPLSQQITAETGKTISDSRVELQRAINTTQASSEECRQISGETLDSDAYAPARHRLGIVCWRPLGTILCITPFNFPLNIAMHKIGPAFAAGNTILFKPSPQNYASAKKLTTLCYQAGIPHDVLQLAVPDITDMAKLIAHPDINAVNFTGGTAAADAIASAAGYKKLLLELGGNDPLILMPDGDIDAAVNAAINQRFATAGQRCTAAKRLFIHHTVYDLFREKLLHASKLLKVGDPSQEDTFIGPLINRQSADKVKAKIDEAIAQGATLTFGGQQQGNIIYPTVLEHTPDNCSVMQDEVFGPVIPLCKFDNLDEIIPLINATPFGLQAGVFTQDIQIIRQLFDTLEVGTLAVNDGPGFRAEHFPFGGVKQSGIGREGVKYAIKEMSFQKVLVL
ncbi:aldehyde dehydrogenase family protein [Zooshikella marina]|uniref:sulfoacetaldehyde dehydrogenase SafD n=1 Tax=Zooshikella ganghwensis TaxID=202772 RepID=UPI001BAE7A81|nr:aldehyde dehydrogenase family protein [Zooshikella ganghwensis]MBU2707070.1 aldehyde dehydrogenase family protein [Zooshikella ganghwensis]